jgi:type IV secretion system protein VirD4
VSTDSLRLPTAPRHFGQTRWGIKLLPLGCFLLANVIVTQEVARRFGFHGLYAPWKWMSWAAQYWLQRPATGPVFQSAILQVIGGLLFGVILARVLMSRETKQALSGSEDLHGSSRWSTPDEIAGMGLTGTSGPYIGAYEDQPNHLQYLRYPGDEHVFAFWPSRTGKTAGIVIPSLLSIADSSILVLDPKDELHQYTSGYRSQLGHVFRFAPLSLTGSRFNIFQEIRFGTLYDVGDAQNIAHMFCFVPGQESKDPHWDQMAAELVTAMILHEGYKAFHEGKTINGVTISNALTSENLPRKFTEMKCYPHDPRLVMGWKDQDGETTDTHPAVRQAARTMLNLCTTVGEGEDEHLELSREAMGYLTNAVKRFNLYKDARVQRSTETSDFTIEDLVNGDKPATLYLHFPLSDEARLQPLARVLFEFLFSRLTEAHRLRQKNKFKLRFLLEEFTSLGYMDIFDKRIADAAGFGLIFILIVQNVEQIYKHYTRYQSIISNCGVQIASAPNDTDTAKEISAMTGTVTLQQLAASFSGDPRSASAKTMTTHVNYIKRELLTPDEVRRLAPPKKEGDKVIAPGDLLVFLRGHYPVKGRQMFYFLDPEFLKRSQIPEVKAWPVLA